MEGRFIPPQDKLKEEVHGPRDACTKCAEPGQRWGRRCPKCGKRFFGNPEHGSVLDAPVIWIREHGARELTRRREEREKGAQEGLAALEAAWRETLAPVGPGPGDEYFADFPPDVELDEGQRAAIRDIRATLARLQPEYVQPQDTTGVFDDRGCYVRLTIPHRLDPSAQIRLIYGDGYLSLTWPEGEEHDKWEWSPLLATAVEALLSGRNVQTFHKRLRRTFAVDTEVWDERGNPTSCGCGGSAARCLACCRCCEHHDDNAPSHSIILRRSQTSDELLARPACRLARVAQSN